MRFLKNILSDKLQKMCETAPTLLMRFFSPENLILSKNLQTAALIETLG